MFLRNVAVLAAALACPLQFASSQNIDTTLDPPSVMFKDSTGKVVISVPVDKHYAALDLNMKVVLNANMAYIVNASGKSPERSISAVNLTTLRVDRVITLGQRERVKLLVSRDGHRLFCYKPSEEIKKGGGSNTVIVIDTASNEVISKLEVSHLDLPEAKNIGSVVSTTSDGRFVFLVAEGCCHRGGPSWQRLIVFPVQSPDSAFVVDPHNPIASLKLSLNEKFLFVAAADKDRAEVVDIVDLEKRTTISRSIDDPLTRSDRLGRFLYGAPPASKESKQGIWVYTRTGLRFLSEDGEIGTELPLPREENVAAMLSKDRTRLFLAMPGSNEDTGVLDIVNLRDGTSSNHPLTEAPRRLARLGSAGELWIIGRREMRLISETGEVGERPILLNKPNKTVASDPESAEAFLNGDPGATISLGEDRAAILVTSHKGESLHRIALLDLKQFKLESMVVVGHAQFSKTTTGRWLTALGGAAAEGAIGAVVLGTTGVDPPMNPYFPGGPGRETLVAPRNGKNQNLYVFDPDTHLLRVVDVEKAEVLRQTELDHSVTFIEVGHDGRWLYCEGTGVFHTIDLESDAKEPAEQKGN